MPPPAMKPTIRKRFTMVELQIVIAPDLYGNFHLPMPSHSIVMWVCSDGQSWDTIATPADNFDTPTRVALGMGDGERSISLSLMPPCFPVGPDVVF